MRCASWHIKYHFFKRFNLRYSRNSSTKHNPFYRMHSRDVKTSSLFTSHLIYSLCMYVIMCMHVHVCFISSSALVFVCVCARVPSHLQCYQWPPGTSILELGYLV